MKLPRNWIAHLALLAAIALTSTGCPHRSPLWSPDGKRILLLAGAGDESVEKPAGGIWLLEGDGGKAARLADPAPGVVYLAAVWIDDSAFAVLTALSADGELKDGSEGVWLGKAGSPVWNRLGGPAPSAEKGPKRLPVVIARGGKKAIVYATGTEAVTAVDLEDGKEIWKLEPAELIGPGPAGGVLVTEPDSQSGGLEIAAVGPDGKRSWTKKFSALTREISEKTGKKTTEITINDTSASAILGSEKRTEIALTLVYTDVSWREGIPGYQVLLDGKDGKLLAAAHAQGLPGRPAELAGAALAVTPLPEKGSDGATIRSFPLGQGGGSLRLDIPGVKRSAVHGYALSPDGKTFGVVLAAPSIKLVLYAVEGNKLGKPKEIDLKS